MLLASLDPVAMLGVMVPILALSIPIVAILLKHQRQMAELIHNGSAANQQQTMSPELQALREEISQLRTQMNSITLALDSVQTKQSTLIERLSDSRGQVQS